MKNNLQKYYNLEEIFFILISLKRNYKNIAIFIIHKLFVYK